MTPEQQKRLEQLPAATKKTDRRQSLKHKLKKSQRREILKVWTTKARIR
jgi:hypothetical protein